MGVLARFKSREVFVDEDEVYSAASSLRLQPCLPSMETKVKTAATAGMKQGKIRKVK